MEGGKGVWRLMRGRMSRTRTQMHSHTSSDPMVLYTSQHQSTTTERPEKSVLAFGSRGAEIVKYVYVPGPRARRWTRGAGGAGGSHASWVAR